MVSVEQRQVRQQLFIFLEAQLMQGLFNIFIRIPSAILFQITRDDDDSSDNEDVAYSADVNLRVRGGLATAKEGEEEDDHCDKSSRLATLILPNCLPTITTISF